MTEIETFLASTSPPARPEPPRDRYGRYLIPLEDGKVVPHTRVTTVAETLDDRYNLELWKQRKVARGLVVRPDLYALVAATPADDNKANNRLCEQAVEAAKASEGANLGTALHRFTERSDAGEDFPIPAPWDADVALYRETLTAHGITVEADLIEQVAVLEGLSEPVAGTLDRIVTRRGRRYIFDLKTGQTLDWSWRAIAVQLALYSRARWLWDVTTKERRPMPAVEQGVALVCHLPAGKATCTIYEVDLWAGWEAAQHALWARRWRKRDDIAVAAERPPDEGELVADERVARLRAAVRDLDADQQKVLTGLVRACAEAGYPLNMDAWPRTERRLALSALCFQLARLGADEEHVRAFLAPVVGESARFPTVTVGAALTALSAAEARILARTAADPFALEVTPDNVIHIHPSKDQP